MAEQVGGETNARHLENPMPGDYWNEMMCPCLVVLGINKRGVLVCDGTKPVGTERWTWDFEKVRTITKDELREAVRHCYCYPEFHKSIVTAFKEYARSGQLRRDECQYQTTSMTA